MLVLRSATLADAAAIADLTAELGYSHDVAAIRHRLEQLLPTPHELVLVAEEAEVVIGWLHAHLSIALESGLRGEIVGLVVSATHRRSGAGRALVRAAEDWAAARGAPVVVVRSNVRREESHRFYLALGFIHSKTQAVYQKPGTVPAA